jgi:hypothetical protein
MGSVAVMPGHPVVPWHLPYLVCRARARNGGIFQVLGFPGIFLKNPLLPLAARLFFVQQ